MSRAVFVVDVKSGQGHLVRSRALMTELASRGWRCSMVSKPPGSVASHDVTIFDGPAFDCPEAYDQASGKPVVAIVDTPGARHGADLTVCGSAGAKPDMFTCSGCVKTQGNATMVVCAGPQYALLRPEFRAMRDWPPYGPMLPMPGVNISRMDGSDCTFDVRAIEDQPAEAIAKWMRAAKVVITYAGMRAMEAACVGAPIEVFVRNEGERLNARGLMNGGAALVFWTSDEAKCNPEDRLAAFCLDTTEGHEALRTMSEAGRALVDGLGCQRVADAIERMIG